MITLLLVAAALAWLFWPKGGVAVPTIPAAADVFKGAPEIDQPLPFRGPPVVPNERDAIDALLVLRDRLTCDGGLPEGSAKAIDQLALDLLHQGAKR